MITLEEFRKTINSGYLNSNDFLQLINQIKELDFVTKSYNICPICDNQTVFFLPFNGRKNAKCPKCGSLERHRFIYAYLKEHSKIFSKKINFLHFAPEKVLFYKFDACENIEYVTADLFLQPFVQVQMDMCNIDYDDNSLDVIMANHILEHIPDDIKAMSELYRVIKPSEEGGCVYIMIPLFRNLEKTFENEEYNTPELRLKYFGQEDHVRKYGMDFVDRLQSVGFKVEEIKPEYAFSQKEIVDYGLMENDAIFICTK